MDYKKIFKSRKIRRAILHMLDFVPDKPMVKLQYRLHNGVKLNLNNPERYTEKLQWYKLFYHDPIMRQCVDKYEVTKYVRSKGLGDILIPEYGCYDDVDAIPWEKLPDSCVLKLTNGGGGLNCIFCTDRDNFDIENAKKRLKDWMRSIRGVSSGREWAYNSIKPRIMCEALLEPRDQNGKGLDDYKFFCFNGKTALKWVDYDRYAGHKRVLFYPDGKRVNAVCTYDSPYDFKYPKEAFDVMQPIVDILSADFPHVRVDLYYTNHTVYFGELTFYSGGGYEMFEPDEFDFWLGDRWGLPDIRI